MHTGAPSGPVVPTGGGRRKERAPWDRLALREERHSDDEWGSEKGNTLVQEVQRQIQYIWVKMKIHPPSPTGVEGLGWRRVWEESG